MNNMNYINKQLDQNHQYILILEKKIEQLYLDLNNAKKALKDAKKVDKSLWIIKNSK